MFKLWYLPKWKVFGRHPTVIYRENLTGTTTLLLLLLQTSITSTANFHLTYKRMKRIQTKKQSTTPTIIVIDISSISPTLLINYH